MIAVSSSSSGDTVVEQWVLPELWDDHIYPAPISAADTTPHSDAAGYSRPVTAGPDCDGYAVQMSVLIDTYSVHFPQAKVKLHQIDKLIFNCFALLGDFR